MVLDDRCTMPASNRPEFVRLWFFDMGTLPVMLCCLDKVLGPGVAGVLRVVCGRPGPSMAPRRAVCSSASSSMRGDCGGRFRRLRFEDCRDRIRRFSVGEGGFVTGSRSLLVSSLRLVYVAIDAFDLGMLKRG